MKAFFMLIIAVTGLLSAFKPQSLKGTWKYLGGMYNGKPDAASKDYTLQRRYGETNFDAYLLEPKQQAYKYQSGTYLLQTDSCFETETFSAQPSKLTGVTLRYHFLIDHDTLKLNGVLPNGNIVEEHWLRLSK